MPVAKQSPSADVIEQCELGDATMVGIGPRARIYRCPDSRVVLIVFTQDGWKTYWVCDWRDWSVDSVRVNSRRPVDVSVVDDPETAYSRVIERVLFGRGCETFDVDHPVVSVWFNWQDEVAHVSVTEDDWVTTVLVDPSFKGAYSPDEYSPDHHRDMPIRIT